MQGFRTPSPIVSPFKYIRVGNLCKREVRLGSSKLRMWGTHLPSRMDLKFWLYTLSWCVVLFELTWVGLTLFYYLKNIVKLSMIKEIVYRIMSGGQRLEVRVKPNDSTNWLKEQRDGKPEPKPLPEVPSVVTQDMLDKADLDQ